MFTTSHFIWIGISLAFIAVLLFLSLKLRFSLKTAAYVMSGLSMASELCKMLPHMRPAPGGQGMVLLAKSLPLHLCSILIFLFFYLALSKNEKGIEGVKSFVVPVSLISGLLALLMATSGVDFRTPQAYQSFLYHAGIVWFALYLIITKQVDMGRKAYLRNLGLLICLMFIMVWVNSALQIYDTNFCFVVFPPAEGLPLLNLDNGWYAYFFSLIGVGVVLLTLAHLKGMICEAAAKRKKTAEPSAPAVSGEE